MLRTNNKDSVNILIHRVIKHTNAMIHGSLKIKEAPVCTMLRGFHKVKIYSRSWRRLTERMEMRMESLDRAVANGGTVTRAISRSINGTKRNSRASPPVQARNTRGPSRNSDRYRRPRVERPN